MAAASLCDGLSECVIDWLRGRVVYLIIQLLQYYYKPFQMSEASEKANQQLSIRKLQVVWKSARQLLSCKKDDDDLLVSR